MSADRFSVSHSSSSPPHCAAGWLRYDCLIVKGSYYWFHRELKLLVVEPLDNPDPENVYALLDRIANFRRYPIAHPDHTPLPFRNLSAKFSCVLTASASNRRTPIREIYTNPFSNDSECEYLVEERKPGIDYAILKVDKRRRTAATVDGYRKPLATNIALDYSQGGEAHFWQHLYWFPFHHLDNECLRNAAIKEHRALVLQSLAWNQLKAPDQSGMTMAEIEENIRYFEYRNDLDIQKQDEYGPIAKNQVRIDRLNGFPVPVNRAGSFNVHHLFLSPDQSDFILAAFALFNKTSIRHPKPVREGWYYIILNILFLGMPPRHSTRMRKSIEEYESTRHTGSWTAFLNQLRQERDSMNIVAGLLLATAAAFIAVPNIAETSRALAMAAAFFSLTCITIGNNPAVNDYFFEVAKLGNLGMTRRLMGQLSKLSVSLALHFTMLWISVLCLFASFVAYIIALRSDDRISFIVLTAIAAVAAVFILFWNLSFQL